jgi:hypothetical protein
LMASLIQRRAHFEPSVYKETALTQCKFNLQMVMFAKEMWSYTFWILNQNQSPSNNCFNSQLSFEISITMSLIFFSPHTQHLDHTAT